MVLMIIFIFLFGLAIGSFLNVLIDRLPNGQDVLWTRSRCDHCKKTLLWFELIPILSWILQRGRCLRCRNTLSMQYPMVELTTAVGFIIGYFLFAYPPAGEAGSLIQLFAYWLIFSSLLVIFVADLKYMVIPDSMVIVGILGALLQGHPLQIPQGVALWISALGAALFFLLLYVITKRRGIGLGDVKLAFLLGFFLGYPKIIFALYAAFLTGALVGVILMMRRKKSLKSKIAFGPFLIVGALIAMLFGEQLLALWYFLF